MTVSVKCERMNGVPHIIGVVDLRRQLKDLPALLRAGPVVLVNRDTPIAVLVSPEEWDRRAAELERLRRESPNGNQPAR